MRNRTKGNQKAYVFETDEMRKLLFLFNEIEILRDRWVLGKLFLADLHQHFDHILNALVDLRLVQERAKAIKDGVRALWRHLGQELEKLVEPKRHSEPKEG